jgi:hypothetical protein
MGARTFISGMKPDIALTLETMDLQLKGVSTTLDLEGALQLLGIENPMSHDEASDDLPFGREGEQGADAAIFRALADDHKEARPR